MKRLSLIAAVLLVLSLAVALPTLAQDAANLITLNDASPAIDVVVTLPADTTGTIALEFSGAAVRLTDSTGAVVFSAADARLHALELNIAPNSGSHTLTIERLPGIVEAVVRVLSLPELTPYGSPEFVSVLAIDPNQETSLPLTADHPGDTVIVTIPGETAGVITATFPGAGATTQLIDAAGVIVVESSGGHVDGLNMLVDAGAYQFTIVGNGIAEGTIAGVRLVSADEVGVVALTAPLNAEAPLVSTCTATVTVSSINMRSGPGTGYTVLNYGYRNQTFVVGGHNPENNWLLVALEDGSTAWVSRTTAQMSGDCSGLTTFNIPFRDAQPAPLIFVTPAPGESAPIVSGGSSGEHEDEHDEEDEHEDEHEEGDDD